MKIRLNSIDKVKNFVNQMSTLDADIDLISGRYVIDAKSIMGVFSLDLTHDIEIKIDTESKEELEKFKNIIKTYTVE